MIAEKSTVIVPDAMTRPDRRWQITLASICGAILAYGVFLSKNDTGNVAFLVGYNALTGLIILAAFRVITDRKMTRQLAGYAYLVILSSLVVASLIGYSRQKPSSDRVAARLSQDVSSITDAGRDNQGNLKKIDLVLDPAKVASGEIGEEERFLKTYLNNVVALRNDYVRGVQAIGMSDIMNTDRIAKDAGLTQSLAMVESATGLLQTFKEKVHALQARTRQEIDTLAIEGSTKERMRVGFDKGLSRSPMDTMADLQAKMFTEYRAIFQLLKDTQGHWAVNKGKFDFQREQDLAAFQAHAEAIDKDSEQGETLEKTNAADVQSTLEGASP